MGQSGLRLPLNSCVVVLLLPVLHPLEVEGGSRSYVLDSIGSSMSSLSVDGGSSECGGSCPKADLHLLESDIDMEQKGVLKMLQWYLC